MIVVLGFEVRLLFSVIIVVGGSAGDGISVRYLEICVFLWCRVKGNSKMRAHAVEKNAFETTACHVSEHPLEREHQSFEDAAQECPIKFSVLIQSLTLNHHLCMSIISWGNGWLS